MCSRELGCRFEDNLLSYLNNNRFSYQKINNLILKSLEHKDDCKKKISFDNERTYVYPSEWIYNDKEILNFIKDNMTQNGEWDIVLNVFFGIYIGLKTRVFDKEYIKQRLKYFILLYGFHFLNGSETYNFNQLDTGIWK